MTMVRQLYMILALLALMCLVVQAAKRRGGRLFVFVLALTALVYLCGVVYFTMIDGPRAGLTGFKARMVFPILRDIRLHRYRPDTHVHLMNILMLVPFGYLLPQRRGLPWWKVILLGFSFSLFIETSQLVFHLGVFELIDLLDNTLGAALGYLLYRICK